MMKNYYEIDKKYVANTYSRYDLMFTHGKGAYLYDENEKPYIDLASGIAVNGFGICDETWQDAVITQVKTLAHTSNLYYTKPQIELANILCEKTGFSRVFFSNSGAEANECAIKTARKYASDISDKKGKYIITLKQSFHGRTVTTLSATGQDSLHTDFSPFTDGFVYATANDKGEIAKLVKDFDCCAIMIELVQGEGGVNVLDKDYVQYISTLAKENDLLLIIDEVQTGNGRTGTLYAYMQYGIEPDIITTAKGLGNGLPIGATFFNEKTMNTLSSGTHGSTFGGNPICCAGAITVVERLTDEFLEEVKKKGEYLKNELKELKNVVSISSLGLMMGIETTKDSKELVKKCIEKGVLVLTAKNKIRLLPPLNIEFDELKKATEILKEIIEE